MFWLRREGATHDDDVAPARLMLVSDLKVPARKVPFKDVTRETKTSVLGVKAEERDRVTVPKVVEKERL